MAVFARTVSLLTITRMVSGGYSSPPEEGHGTTTGMASYKSAAMLLREALELYVSTNPRINSDQTARRYLATIIALEKFLERSATIEDLDADTYGRWVRHRRDKVGVAPSTLHGECQKLLVLWRWLAKRRDVDVAEPTVALPRKFEAEPETWTVEQYAALEAAARRCTWYVGQVPGKVYWPALLGVAVETGERLGALHKLELHHFDFAKMAVTFPAAIRKGNTRDLTRRISLQTGQDVQALAAYRPMRPFAALLQPSLYHPMRRLLCDAGLPSGRGKLFHCLRRYHATRVVEAGGNAQRSLDHSDGRVTARYVDTSQLGPEPMPERPRPARGWFWWLPQFRRA